MNTFRKLRAFCRVLKGKRHWALRTKAPFWIRTTVEGEGQKPFCPLTYACYVASGKTVNVSVCDFVHAAERFDFDANETDQIAAAADGDTAGKNMAKLRRILLKACGLSVTK